MWCPNFDLGPWKKFHLPTRSYCHCTCCTQSHFLLRTWACFSHKYFKRSESRYPYYLVPIFLLFSISSHDHPYFCLLVWVMQFCCLLVCFYLLLCQMYFLLQICETLKSISIKLLVLSLTLTCTFSCYGLSHVWFFTTQQIS